MILKLFLHNWFILLLISSTDTKQGSTLACYTYDFFLNACFYVIKTVLIFLARDE